MTGRKPTTLKGRKKMKTQNITIHINRLSTEHLAQFAKIIYESGQNDWANTIKQINNQEAYVNG